MATEVAVLGNGSDGEVIAYNPRDDFMYHWSGNGTVDFERINLTTFAVTPITAVAAGEIFGAVWDECLGLFRTTNINSQMEFWSTTGVRSNIQPATLEDARGLALLPANSCADLTIVKSDAPDPVVSGTSLTYTLATQNVGAGAASTVTVSDVLPAGVTFVSLTAPPGWSCTTPAVGAGGTVSCTIATYAAAATANFTLIVQVSPSVASGTVISNTATISASLSDLVPANNTSTTTTTAMQLAADLSITKTASAGPYGTGLPVTYTIVVTNAGPAAATSVVVTDILPAGMTFGSATPTQGSCSGTTTVTCSLGTIAASGTATITLNATLPSTPGPVSNTATVSAATVDPVATNNSGNSTIVVIAAALIPTLSPIALLMLGLALSLIVVVKLQQ